MLVNFSWLFACRNLARECVRVIKIKTPVKAWLGVAIQLKPWHKKSESERKGKKKVSGRKGKNQRLCVPSSAQHKSDNDLEVFAGERVAVVTASKLCPLVYSQGQRRETMAIDLAPKRRRGKDIGACHITLLKIHYSTWSWFILSEKKVKMFIVWSSSWSILNKMLCFSFYVLFGTKWH